MKYTLFIIIIIVVVIAIMIIILGACGMLRGQKGEGVEIT